MLVNSPMANTGGADAALEVVTGTPDALAVNPPQRAVVSKTQISAMICRSDYTGQGDDVFDNAELHTTPTVMTHIREGGSITAVLPSSDKCSDSRCICDIDLNVPLHKRLNANLESRVNEDLDSAFLLEPKCGFSWTDSVIDSKVSSCSLTSNVDSSLCLMPVIDERCRELSPSCHEDCRSAQTECEEDRAKQEQAEVTGQNITETVATGFEENLADWDPETPVKPTYKKRRRRRDTGDFLMIHMNMQTLEDDFDTPNNSKVGSPGDVHLKVRRSRRLRRKSMQLQMMPPGGIAKQEQAEETGPNKAEITITSFQENLANWDPETPLNLTRKKQRRRRDTGDFLTMNMQTLEDNFDVPDKPSIDSPSDVRLKVKQSRRKRRKSVHLQMLPPDGTDEEQIRATENSAMNMDATTVFNLPIPPSDDIYRVIAAPEEDARSDSYDADRAVVPLCSSLQQQATPSDDTPSDMTSIEQSDTTNKCPSNTEPIECPSLALPSEMFTGSLEAPLDHRSSRRRKCTQRIKYVEIDVSPETPKKKQKKQKRDKKLELASLEDIYNNCLWRDQMPTEDQRWTTIPEEDDSVCSEPDSFGTVTASRVTSKRRTINFSDFYSKARLTKRRQKARRQGWKPQRKKLAEKEVFAELLESKLNALDNELRQIDN